MNMTNKNKMRNYLVVLFTLSSLILAGCATPKPAPTWPSGTERPINKTPTTMNTSEVKK